MKVLASNSLDGLDWADAGWAKDAPWDESKINREPEGEGGGQFAAGTGAGSASGAAAPRTETPPPTRNAQHKSWEARRAKAAAAAEGGAVPALPKPTAKVAGTAKPVEAKPVAAKKKGGAGAHLVPAPADRAAWPEHIKAMVIPPAWTDVKIAMDPNADLCVIGKDKAGRDQYVYSEKFAKSQAALKFARIESLRKDKPMIESQLAEMRKSADPNQRDHADCAFLIMKMGVRPGSDTDTKALKKAYGATTLEGKHVVEEQGQLFLRFTGKKGMALNLAVEDKTLAANLRIRAKKAGDDGRLYGNTNGGTLLGFVHDKLDHGGMKTKDFRTLVAADISEKMVRKSPAPTNPKEYKKAVREVAIHVSSKLGNTPTVALQSYIPPWTFTQWKANAGA